MEKGIIKCLTKYVDYLEELYKVQNNRAADIKDLKDIKLHAITKPSGLKYYSYSRLGSTKYKYLGKETCEAVENIKEANYYKVSIPRIASNLNLCMDTLEKLKKTDYDSINEALPQVYQNAKVSYGAAFSGSREAQEWKRKKEDFKERRGPWYPEDLRCTTVDKSLVRSKSEALIYNHYYSQKCTFVYELPIKLRPDIWRHPDFTLLCETDWTSFILHDHEGRYGYEEDRKRYNNDMYLYWNNGFIPGVNIFYTFDDPRGGFDISVVQNIIDSKIRVNN